MFFEGMVKVSKEDIGKFLEVWADNVEIYNEAVRVINFDQEQFYNNLTWWGKLFYDKDDSISNFHKKAGFKNGKYKHYYEIMIEMGYLPDRGRWKVLYLNEKVFIQIRNMSKLGGTIYLTPDQAHLMTKVLKMEKL